VTRRCNALFFVQLLPLSYTLPKTGDMPENEACEGAVAMLRRQHEHIGELLRELNDGRWWPDDHAGNEDAVNVLTHARNIEESVCEISRIVATMKD
jgi:hypothetical protein